MPNIIVKKAAPRSLLGSIKYLALTISFYEMPIARQMIQYKNGRLASHLSRYSSHLGDTRSAVGVIAFTVASLLIAALGPN